ncbi:uncharacterized protein SCDLUD_002862 [Saccharomycodes ludwigii]|uniref:uncharacterized protein n=1 Tax=Saccharomycodes ludwigii TaxID=36035 RepID=UPI001E860CA8|nr:hypothetical protein SCDLUD_002862 [Saccharomycodes ludwigii]KAH3901370.1 hypothetical protein SCDLUD_002862 [Saccharomycodes ludwigii]
MTKPFKWNIYDKIRFNRILLKYINKDGIKKHANDILHDMNDKNTLNRILFISKVLDVNNCETVEYTKENIVEYLKEIFDNNSKDVLTLEDFNYRIDVKEQSKDEVIDTIPATDRYEDKEQILETLVPNTCKGNEFDSSEGKNITNVDNDYVSSSRTSNTIVTNVGDNNDSIGKSNDIGTNLQPPLTATAGIEKNNFTQNSVPNKTMNTDTDVTSINTLNKNISPNLNPSDTTIISTKATKSQVKSTKGKSRPVTKINISGSKSSKDNYQYDQKATNRFGRNTRIVIEKGDEDDNSNTNTNSRDLKNISDNPRPMMESLNLTLNADNGKVTKEQTEKRKPHLQPLPAVVSSSKTIPATVKKTNDTEVAAVFEDGMHNDTSAKNNPGGNSLKIIKENNDNDNGGIDIDNKSELDKDNSIKKYTSSEEKNEKYYVAKEQKKERSEEKKETYEQNKMIEKTKEATKFQKDIPNKEEHGRDLAVKVDIGIGGQLIQNIEAIPDVSQGVISVVDSNNVEQEGKSKTTTGTLKDKTIANVVQINNDIIEENVGAKSDGNKYDEGQLELPKINANIESYGKNVANKVNEQKKDTISTSESYQMTEATNNNENITDKPTTIAQEENMDEAGLVNEEDEDNESKLSQVDDEVDVEKDEHVKVQVGILESLDEHEGKLDTKGTTQSDDINHVFGNKEEDGKDKHTEPVGHTDNQIDKEITAKMFDTENGNKMGAEKGEIKEEAIVPTTKDKDQYTRNYSLKDNDKIKMVQKQQDKTKVIKPRKKGNKGKRKLIETKEEEEVKQNEFKNTKENRVTIEKSTIIEDAPIESRTRSKLKIKEDIESIVYQRDGQQENILSARNRRKPITKILNGEGENKRTSSGKTIVVGKATLTDDDNIRKEEMNQKQENDNGDTGKGEKEIERNEEEKFKKRNTIDNYNSNSFKNENIPKAVTRKSARIRKRIREGSDNIEEERISKQTRILKDEDSNNKNSDNDNDNRANSEGGDNKNDNNEATNSKKNKEVTNIVKKSRSLRNGKTKIDNLSPNNKSITNSSDNIANKKNEKSVANDDSPGIKNNNEFTAIKDNVTLNNTTATVDTEPIGRRLRKRK